MDYGFIHADQVFTPNGTIGINTADNDARNAEIERAELTRWADTPDSMLAYYTIPDAPVGGLYRRTFDLPVRNATVSTWLGTKIGSITTARVYGHNFGGRILVITVQGTNGARYYGRASWDNGTAIRLRKGGSR
jgi:hypothetical protein